MATSYKKTVVDDENPANLVKLDDHEKDIRNLSERIKSLEEQFGTKEKISEIFCGVLKTQKPIDSALKDIMKELITKDHDTIEFLRSQQQKINDDDWKSFIKKIGVAGWIFLGTILGAAATTIVGMIIHHYL